jgi:hypothetical protein
LGGNEAARKEKEKKTSNPCANTTPHCNRRSATVPHPHPHPTLHPPAEARGYARTKETTASAEQAGSDVNQAGGRSLHHTHEHKEPEPASHEKKKKKEERGPEIRNRQREKKSRHRCRAHPTKTSRCCAPENRPQVGQTEVESSVPSSDPNPDPDGTRAHMYMQDVGPSCL